MLDVVVIGGGLAGASAALALASAGLAVVLVERGARIGGLAGSFRRDGRSFPLGYHHIGAADPDLHTSLRALGLWDRVRWRRMPMGFLFDGEVHTLATARGFARFPVQVSDKARLAALGAALLLGDRPRPNEDVAGWLRRRVGSRLVDTLFGPLTQLKFGCPPEELDAAWFHARLTAREADGRFGYVHGEDWTALLCDALESRVRAAGVTLHFERSVARVEGGARAERIVLDDGTELRPRAVVAAVAPPVLAGLMEVPLDPALAAIRYTGVVSLVMGVPDEPPLPCYWTNAMRPRRSYGGLFRLDLLNPGLARPGERVLNVAAHLTDRGPDSLLRASDQAILARFAADLHADLGWTARPTWHHVARLPWYSPIFHRGWTNPPLRSGRWPNLVFAGNFRTWPAVATTGRAMASGREAAAEVLRTLGPKDANPSGSDA